MTDIDYTNTIGRYKLPDRKRTTVAVSPKTHLAIKIYAQSRKVTLEKAVEELLKIAIDKVRKLPL